MLKTLIKKQLLELNKSFFVDRKTGKGKSARSATFSIVLFILLMILPSAECSAICHIRCAR